MTGGISPPVAEVVKLPTKIKVGKPPTKIEVVKLPTKIKVGKLLTVINHHFFP